MATSFQFTKTSVKSQLLAQEITNNSVITTLLSHIIWEEPNFLEVVMVSDLSAQEETELGNIVTNHDSTAPFIQVREQVPVRNLLFDDWTSRDISGLLGWESSSTNGGTASSTSDGVSITSPGAIQLRSGTSSNGTVTYSLGKSAYKLGGGLIQLETRILLPNLATTGDDYKFRFGLFDLDNEVPDNGVIFSYNRNNILNWELITRIDAGTPTVIDSGVPVTANPVLLGMQINNSANIIHFFIDDIHIEDITTNIPNTGQPLGPGYQFIKTAGTTNRRVLIDYFIMTYDVQR